MRYRREDPDGSYTFGQGDDVWLTDSPDAVAQAVKTRLTLWRGQWFLDTTEGTPWGQSVLGRQKSEIYELALRRRILETPGVNRIMEFSTSVDPRTRRMTFTATLDTIYGITTVTLEA